MPLSRLSRRVKVFSCMRTGCARSLSAAGSSVDRLDDFPQGLGGIYWQFFRRSFPDPTEYTSRDVPVLQAICAAREPLETSYLDALFEWTASVLRSRLGRLGSLFPTINDRVRAFHKSVFDWLTNEN